MRSHAKASTAGSTQRQAGRLSSGLGRLACLAVLSLLVFLIPAAPALAGTATDRPLLFGFNGSDTTAGTFTSIGALEIDQANGTVYVIDQGHNVLGKFNPAGEAQNFSATGSSSLSPGLSFNSLADVAVDNSATNPGRIHVMREFGPVRAFSSAGASLWELSVFSPNDVCGLAIDASGHPWIGDYMNRKAREYDTSGSPPAEIGSLDTEPDLPCRLDFDASGNAYINRFTAGVDKYVGGVKAATIDAGFNRGVTVDQSSATGHVFTLHVEDFSEYDSAGALVGSFGMTIGDGQGIAYNSTLDRVYVADRASNTVKVFGPVESGTVPDVSIEPTSEIGVSKAKFNAKINPQGVPNSYFFEWKEGTEASWAGAKSTAPQSIEPTDSADHAVSFDAAGLPGDRTLQVRLVGINTDSGLRAASGPDTFATTAAAVVPAVTIDAPSAPTTTTAQISGTVNPREDAGTTWRVETSTDSACAAGFTNKPLNDLNSEAATPVAVAEELTGLLPSQHYCVRITATNSAGTTESAVVEFETDPVIPTEAETAFAAPRTDTSARLNGRIDPKGAPLAYRFEYSADGGATWIALPEREDTSEARGEIIVSDELTGLEPATAYSFRFLAENGAGEASPQGGEKTFATRTTAEATLPERGIELVNNPDKGNQNVLELQARPGAQGPMMTADGNSVIWAVTAGAPGAPNGSRNAFLAQRTLTGWQSRPLAPPAEQQIGGGNFEYISQVANPDFSRFVFGVDNNRTLVRLDAERNEELLKISPFSLPGGFGVVDMTDDSSHVLFIDAVSKQLEDIGSGSPEVVSVMPDGTKSACGLLSTGASFAGASSSQWQPGYHRMATTDASRAYFLAKANGDCSGPNRLYVRNRDTESTTEIAAGEVEMIRATPDGRSLYYLHSQTDPLDANVHTDVYRWDEAANDSTCLTCEVAPDADVIANSNVVVSGDFSHVYFVSEQQLTPEAPAAGLSVYTLSNGEIRLVADISGSEEVGFLKKSNNTEVSTDGDVLVFRAKEGPNLTSDAIAAGTAQLYRYDDRDGSLECISCRPGGEATDSAGALRLSADGSTAGFGTDSRLAHLDVNGDTDLYEWRNGSLRLITDGVTDFQEGIASPGVWEVNEDGRNILFSVVSPGLTGFEQDGFVNLYSAQIGGGFTPPSTPPDCEGDSCQGPLHAPPLLNPPGSSSFSGRGNAAPASGKRRPCARKRGKAKRRCVRQQRKKRNQARAQSNSRRAK